MVQLGTSAVAVNAISNSLLSVRYAAATSAATIAVTLVGRCIGAERQNVCRDWGELLHRAATSRKFRGAHVHFGKNVYANFNLTRIDDTHTYVGDGTMIGPNVTLATAGHPILPELRARAYQYNLPISIGKNCWLGAGVIVLPGVKIGDNTVVGAGSVVSKDLPANVVAVGCPCRVLREIGEHDRLMYCKDKKIDWESLKNEDE